MPSKEKILDIKLAASGDRALSPVLGHCRWLVTDPKYKTQLRISYKKFLRLLGFKASAAGMWFRRKLYAMKVVSEVPSGIKEGCALREGSV